MNRLNAPAPKSAKSVKSWIIHEPPQIELTPVIEELVGLFDRSGMTYQQAADAAGLSRGTVWNIYVGLTLGPRITTVAKLAAVFGKTVALVDGRMTLQ